MAITKTGVRISTDSVFDSSDMDFWVDGKQLSVQVTGLSPETPYYAKAMMIENGEVVYGGNVKTFTTVIDEKQEYFYIENCDTVSGTVNFQNMANKNIEYSTDKVNWTTLDLSTVTATIDNVTVNQKVYLRGTNSAVGSITYAKHISADFNHNLGGNICSLLDKTNFRTMTSISSTGAFRYLFYQDIKLISAYLNFGNVTTLSRSSCMSMFQGCTSLTTAPELPATTLASSCYSNMFQGCTSLMTAPELPAATLASSCYYYMFSSCTGLTTAPELPATTLASNCYESMFSGCTGLTTAPELPATTLDSKCYSSMFSGCTGLTTAPELPATTLVINCYDSMFRGCTSLTTAPELPATTLASSCYFLMFYGCTSLTTAPELPATNLATQCYSSMFYGCTGLTTAPELPATTLASSCYYNMFQGCISLTTAPELPATNLATQCYSSMFRGCTSLNYIKIGATTWDTSAAYMWVQNVSATGDFYCPASLTITTGTDGIPSGWTRHNI